MWIQQVLVHRIAPFHDDNFHAIEFCRGFNLVRGVNGIGKTTVLEALALVGHIPLYRVQVGAPALLTQSHVQCRLAVEAGDIELMSSTLASLDALVDPESRFAALFAPATRRALASRLVRLQTGCAISFGIAIDEHGQRTPDLKDLLSREDRLRTEVTLCVADPMDGLLLQFLVGIGRPEVSRFAMDAQGERDMKKPAGWFRSPRQALLEREVTHPRSVPGFVGYFHTDMYRWGVGNDVRESPKELFHRMTPLMVAERFRMFQGSGSSGHRNVRHFSHISELWSMIMAPTGERRRLSSVRLREPVSAERSVEVRISDHDVNIVSSGENQALFLLLWTIANSAYGSCLLVDEPEVHLSPGAAGRTIEFLQALTRGRGNQVICATHAAVIPKGVRASRNDSNRLIYLTGADQKPLEDEDAVKALSRDMQETINQLVAAMRPVIPA